MKLSEYREYDGIGLSKLLYNKQVSPRELLDVCLLAIEEVNPALNFLAQDLRHAAASQLKNINLTASPLAGVPILIKDLVLKYEGTPTCGAVKVLKNANASKNSALADAYLKAGLIFAGKSTTSELGLNTFTQSRHYGETRNPWDTDLSPGGSSGGAGAAVASGAVPIAHGNDGGCSLRSPASHCGLVGLVPSRGRVSNAPDVNVWHGLLCQNAVTRTVRDSAAMLDIATTTQGMPPEMYDCPKANGSFLAKLQQPLRPLKIAVCRTPFFGGEVDPAVLEGVNSTIDLLEEAGHHVEDAGPSFIAPTPFKQAFAEVVFDYFAQLKRDISREIGRKLTADDVEASTWTVMRLGECLSQEQALRAKQLIFSQARATEQLHQHYDLLLTPTLPTLPPESDALRAPVRDLTAFRWIDKLGFTRVLWKSETFRKNSNKLLDYIGFVAPFSCTGQPAITLPLHWHQETVPVGMQFVAPVGREDVLLCLGAQLEQMRPWAHRRPSVDITSHLDDD
ncbi:MAG: amidase [Gammaproteobacteria bacterium]|nr:MAG: amidase [Gammaproteobacteria bacterium]